MRTEQNLQVINNVLKVLPLQAKANPTYIKPNYSLDFNTRVNNYVSALLSKHWEKLLKLINLKRNSFLSDKIYLKLQKPSVTIEHIKSSHSINLDKVLNNNNKTNPTDILTKVPLDKNDYYFEVNLLFNDKILYCDTCNVEIIIDSFLQNSIDKKFKYKIFYHYKY
jgi:hypothetical protein